MISNVYSRIVKAITINNSCRGHRKYKKVDLKKFISNYPTWHQDLRTKAKKKMKNFQRR